MLLEIALSPNPVRYTPLALLQESSVSVVTLVRAETGELLAARRLKPLRGEREDALLAGVEVWIGRLQALSHASLQQVRGL